MKRVLSRGIVLVALFLSACSSAPTRLSSEFDVSTVDRTRGEQLQASASGFQLMLFIPIAVNARFERAMESLREQAGDRVLADIKIEERWQYAFVGTIYSTTITATAYPRIAK